MAAKNGKPKPKMLKEFLRDDSPSNYKSSNGFKPNNPFGLPDDNSDPTTNNNLLRSRSRSRTAAYAAVSPFQKVLNAVKSFHYSSTPLTLQRSVSRRLLGKWNAKKRSNSSGEVMSSKIVVVTVKVKDILRWRSFRDLVVDHQDESQPSDVVGSTDAPPSTSNSNSCVESDFTDNEVALELPRWWSGNSGDDEGENSDKVVASDSEVGPTEDYHKTASEEGTEQQSPVSVLGSPFRDEEVSDEEFPSTFEQSLANMERTKQRFLQSIQLFESLAGVHDDEDDETAESIDEKEEVDDKFETTSKACLRGGFCWFERGEEGLKDKKECMQGMEIQGKWSKFEEERTEVGLEIEVELLNDLFDEILFDL